MDPIQLLMDEHRVIERVLNGLESFSEKPEGTKSPLKDYVVFLREYADRLHHGKEEDILFDQMVKNGFPKEGGPIAVMLMEHDQGRAYIRALTDLAERERVWTPEDRGLLHKHGTEYVNLLRAHIQKEDQILYPMARSRLTESAWAIIVNAVTRFEEDSGHREAKARFEKFVAAI